MNFREYLLESRQEPRTFRTPWGLGRSLNVEQLREISRGRRGVTWAERWVIARDRHEDGGASPGEAAMLATADTMRERAATAHLRVACPRCSAPVGERCVRMSAHHPGWAGADEGRRKLKHSHRDRLRADGIPER